MDADGSTKRSRPGRHPTKKLKFKPRVPPQKPKKLTTEKPEQEQPVPVDEELIKMLRTPKKAAKTSPKTKEERSKQSPPLAPPSAAVVSLSPPQSGLCMQNHSMTQQSPRAFPVTVNPGVLYEKEEEYDDEDDDNDEDDDDDNIELQENQQSSTECEASTYPAEELGLLNEKERKERMFLFQLPKTLPLPKRSSIVERNGKATNREVKQGSNLQQLPQGYLGKMLVYKSGKIKMKIGDVMFDVCAQVSYFSSLVIPRSRICMIIEVLLQVNPGAESRMVQQAVVVNSKEKHCCLLGEIENRHVIVTPDVDSLLNDN